MIRNIGSRECTGDSKDERITRVITKEESDEERRVIERVMRNDTCRHKIRENRCIGDRRVIGIIDV